MAVRQPNKENNNSQFQSYIVLLFLIESQVTYIRVHYEDKVEYILREKLIQSLIILWESVIVVSIAKQQQIPYVRIKA
jgi:hypothetical protein